MKRNAIQQLIAWKECEDRKPICITGVKGTGKTYLALEFAKSFFEGNIYINFENNANIRDYIAAKAISVNGELNFIEMLCEYYQIPEELIGNLLIILDEIHECREAVTLLLDFVKKELNIPIVVLSSNEEAIADDISNFPHLKLYPMGFDEFLVALGHEWYAEVIKGHYQTNRKIPQIVHTELLTLFEDYLLVGGMPAAVNEYINADATYNVPEIHKFLFHNIQTSCSLGKPESDALKIQQVLNVLVEQLLKENKKFQYRLIRKGATYAMYKDAIDYLVELGYLLKCKKVDLDTSDKNGELLEASTQFKLYMNDVGILNSMIHKRYVRDESNEDLIRKTLIENYTLQALTANGYAPNFWESSSQAKIDFLIETKDGLVPIESKTNDNTRSKSISVFKNQYEIPYSIKISSRNYEFSNGIKYIPYYAIFCL